MIGVGKLLRVGVSRQTFIDLNVVGVGDAYWLNAELESVFNRHNNQSPKLVWILWVPTSGQDHLCVLQAVHPVVRGLNVSDHRSTGATSGMGSTAEVLTVGPAVSFDLFATL